MDSDQFVAPPRVAESRRSARYPFLAQAEISDLESGLREYAQVTDISANGCFMELPQALPVGKHIFVKIFTSSGFFEAGARVVHSQPNSGMGLEFHGISRHFRPTLQRWLLEGVRTLALKE